MGLSFLLLQHACLEGKINKMHMLAYNVMCSDFRSNLLSFCIALVFILSYYDISEKYDRNTCYVGGSITTVCVTSC